MSPEAHLSVSDIIDELKIGKAHLNFILKRFQHFLPCEMIQGRPLYLPEALQTIAVVTEKLEMGQLPSEIENNLKKIASEYKPPITSTGNNNSLAIHGEDLVQIKTLLKDFNTHQKKIAEAHEKRAVAEERKAIAIEKRAAAEEKKAQAMSIIAKALQEMNQIRGRGPASEPEQQIATQAISIIASDEIQDEVQDEILKKNAIPEPEPTDLDDLSALLSDENQLTGSKVSGSDVSTETAAASQTEPVESVDDLNALIAIEPDGLDDLSTLLDDESSGDTNPSAVATVSADRLDDLSLLLDEEAPISQGNRLDDLSSLLDNGALDSSAAQERDSQPETIFEPEANIETDDLSKLVDNDADSNGVSDIQIDVPQITISESPDNVEAYKAAIMKEIIGLKTQGMSPEEATSILNHNKIQTLSGKPEWGQKALTQIYKFIESAAS